MSEFTESEKRILDRISDPQYSRSLGDIRRVMERIWANDAPRIVQNYTDHGEKHSERIAYFIEKLLEVNPSVKFHELEIYLLLAGVYLHDIGMQCDILNYPKVKKKAEELGAKFTENFISQAENGYLPKQQDDIRKNHHYLSAAWIDYLYKGNDQVLSPLIKKIPPDLVKDLMDVCMFHSKLEIDTCDNYLTFEPNCRKKLVAALLRFADELDITSNRVNIETVKIFSMNSENSIHWWLHNHTKITFIGSNKVHFDIILHPEDFVSYGSLVRDEYITNFKKKNQSVLEVLVEESINVVIDRNSNVVSSEYAEKFPLAITTFLDSKIKKLNQVLNSQTQDNQENLDNNQNRILDSKDSFKNTTKNDQAETKNILDACMEKEPVIKEEIAIVGTGAFGTSIAIVLANAGHSLRLYVRELDTLNIIEAYEMNQTYLPGHKIDSNDKIITNDLSHAVKGAKYIFITVPSQCIKEVVTSLKDLIDDKAVIVLTSKGMILEGELVSELTHKILPNNKLCGLYGITFAELIAGADGFSSMCIASLDETIALKVANLFMSYRTTSRFRIYTSTDLRGIEFGGAMKNVYAIAMGLYDGYLEYMQKEEGSKIYLSRHSFLNLCVMEFIELGLAYEANLFTLLGPSGVGDIIACSNESSRNYRYGKWRAALEFKEPKAQFGRAPALHEGYDTIIAAKNIVEKINKKSKIETPILDAVHEILIKQKDLKTSNKKIVTIFPPLIDNLSIIVQSNENSLNKYTLLSGN